MNNIPEPIPQGFECSLMISSKIWFENILAQCLSQSGWILAGVAPVETNKAWQAKFTSGSISGAVDLNAIHKTVNGYMSIVETSYSILGDIAIFSIAEMLLKPRTDGQIDLSFSSQEKPSIVKHIKASSQLLTINTYEVFQISFTLTINAQLPLSVTGTGQEQKIQIVLTDQSVNIDARTSCGGPCGCDDLEAQVNTKLKAQIPAEITSKLNLNFDPVSVFALKNLLFPAKNFINLQEIYVPSDVLILRNFTS